MWGWRGARVWDRLEKQWVVKTGQSIWRYILYTIGEPAVYVEVKLEGQPNKPTYKTHDK